MGAAVTVELTKPTDASDISQTNDLTFARNEIIRLRKELGHLAQAYGVNVLSYDASDIVLGENEEEDFQRCVREIAHIRQCLRLNTQQSMRQQRNRSYQRHSSSGHFVPLKEVGRLSEEKRSEGKYDEKYDGKEDEESGSDSESNDD